MTAKAQSQIAGILDAYDFSRFRSIADIGGGRGHLLQAVLGRAPEARGVLFDLPHVVDAAKGLASDRLSLAGGDFFRDRLPACDAYLLMEVIHDWDDEKSTAILKAVRAAAPEGATLLLLETIVPDEPGPHWAKTLDVVMLENHYDGGPFGGRFVPETLMHALRQRSAAVIGPAFHPDAGRVAHPLMLHPDITPGVQPLPDSL